MTLTVKFKLQGEDKEREFKVRYNNVQLVNNSLTSTVHGASKVLFCILNNYIITCFLQCIF